jgi:hypothetical protein
MRLTTSIIVCAVGLAAGCAAKKDTDQKVDDLIAVLQRGDYAAFKALAAPALATVVPEAKFQTFAKVTRRLGAYQRRTMTGIEVKTGGVRKGTYSVVFASGVAELEVSTVEGRLMGFNLTGDSVRRVMKELDDEQYATFKVASFQFEDEKREPRTSNIYKLGQTLYFTMVVHGVTYRDAETHARCRLQVFDAGNQRIADFPRFLDKVMRPESKQRLVTVTGNLKLPRPGSYRLQLTFTDVFGGERQLEHAQAVIVE